MNIVFRDVWKSFGDKQVLAGLSLDIRPAEVTCIIGTSGVGKSVAIKLLIGLLRVDRGEIHWGDLRLDALDEAAMLPVRKRIGMVFQNATLFDSFTLAENVALPLRKHKRMSMREAMAQAHGLLQRVGMADFADRYPAELGGGLRKRAAIARTLSLDPEVVLFDEPTTGLDPMSARRIDRLIRQLSDESGVTSVVVSHDLTSIFAIADRIAFLYRGVAHLCGAPAEFRSSPDPVVQQFIAGRSSGEMETPGF